MPPGSHVFQCFPERQPLLPHEVRNDDGSAAADAHLAVHQHLAVWKMSIKGGGVILSDKSRRIASESGSSGNAPAPHRLCIMGADEMGLYFFCAAVASAMQWQHDRSEGAAHNQARNTHAAKASYLKKALRQ